MAGNAAGFGIGLEDGARAVGDVAQVTKHGALLSFVDGAIELGLASDGVEEVPEVGGVTAAGALAFGDFDTFRIVDGPSGA